MTYFLNDDVKTEVEASPILYLAWHLTNSKYDGDIDPLHNPDYVRKCKNIEIERLKSLKKKIYKDI